MIADMEGKLDPAQYGNHKGISIQHYLIKMVHRILSVLDNNSKRETFAIFANLIDWKDAFPKQCPKLGIESFMRNGVRPSLIPVFINYFQDREMSVKWHGTSVDDLKNIYFLFIRSLLEQSATVWHSGLSDENSNEIERVQKSAVKIILGEQYVGYENALVKLNMESLKERRVQLCTSFALK